MPPGSPDPAGRTWFAGYDRPGPVHPGNGSDGEKPKEASNAQTAHADCTQRTSSWIKALGTRGVEQDVEDFGRPIGSDARDVERAPEVVTRMGCDEGKSFEG